MALPVKDGNGTARNLPLFDAAYRVGSTVAPGAAPTTIIQLQGPTSGVARVKRIALHLQSGTVAGGSSYSLNTRSTAASGGVAVTPTIGKLDSNDAAATCVLKHFTTAPTAGTLTAQIGHFALDLAATTAQTARDVVVYDFTIQGCKPPTLNSSSEFLTVDMATAAATGQILGYEIQWEEGTA